MMAILLCFTEVLVIVDLIDPNPSHGDIQATAAIYIHLRISKMSHSLKPNREPRRGLSWPNYRRIIRLPPWRAASKSL
jgi:hypothetical protein